MTADIKDLPSMNEASERDPFNNNCYGTLVDSEYKLVSLPVLDVHDFNERIIRGYEEGYGEKDLPADLSRGPLADPGRHRVAARLQLHRPGDPRVHPRELHRLHGLRHRVPGHRHPRQGARRGRVGAEARRRSPRPTGRCTASSGRKTKKYYDAGKKKAGAGGMFQIIIDPSQVQGLRRVRHRLRRRRPEDDRQDRRGHDQVPQEPSLSSRTSARRNEKYISDNLLIDMMLKEQTHIYTGGAGSCAGCGEGTALRMLCAATGSKYGDQWGIVAATGCNTVYTSTYPYNPYLVPWTNSLFENAPTDAIGVRMRWDQMGWQDKPIWCIGGDGAMFDIGFQALSRMFASGMNIKVFVLDTQVYSNTGGQASTASFTGQNTKMSVHGKAFGGKQERRKEIAQIAMMHPRTYVAQTTCAHINHFYKSVLGALEFDGPAIVVCYTTCQPEHGVADNMAGEQARLAVDTRAFPLLIYDPRKGDTIKKRLSLQGNPNVKDDWFVNPKTNEEVTFIDFARSEGRFAKHFDKDGNPSPTLMRAKQDRLENWHLLQELAGLRGSKPAKGEAKPAGKGATDVVAAAKAARPRPTARPPATVCPRVLRPARRSSTSRAPTGWRARSPP